MFRVRLPLSLLAMMAALLPWTLRAQRAGERPAGNSGQPTQSSHHAPRDEAQGQPGQNPLRGGQPQQGQAREGQPREGQPRPRAPFELTQEQYAELFAVLKAWERDTAAIDNMRCTLSVFQYKNDQDERDQGALPNNDQKKRPPRLGELKFKSPDKGLYRIKDDAGKDWLEHWLCDGKAVFVYDAKEKRLNEFPIPPELQGKRIADGPLPFLFGADANRLLQRYFMRIVTPPAAPRDQIWIQALPRYQADAANYQAVVAILTITEEKTLQPFAVKAYLPDGSRVVHRLDNLSVNERRLFQRNDFAPYLPSGWTKVVHDRPRDEQGGGRVGAQPASARAPERRGPVIR
jgi:TIGR03009 family protein